MFQTFNNPEYLTKQEIIKRYPHSKYILQDIKDINNIAGYLLAVSTNSESFHDICKYRDELSDKNLDITLMGSYSKSGLGVICEL